MDNSYVEVKIIIIMWVWGIIVGVKYLLVYAYPMGTKKILH